MAAFYNRPDVLRALVETGADLRPRGLKGATLLYVSAVQGHCEVAKILLENGSDPSWVDEEGRAASFQAANGEHCKIPQILAVTGDDLRGVDKYGNSLLHSSASGGAREAFEMLVNTRAYTLRWRNINTESTPIHSAIVESSVEMAKHVLEAIRLYGI